MMPVAEWNLGVIIVVYVWIGIWSIYFTLDMLRDLFASAVGKHKLQYIKSCTSLQRICKTYILKITRYRHKISMYLVYNYISTLIASIVLAAMLVLWRIVAIWSWDVVKIYAALVIAIMIIPPIVLSFIVTRYRGGHPRYEFDLDIKFSGRKEIEKRSLVGMKSLEEINKILEFFVEKNMQYSKIKRVYQQIRNLLYSSVA